MIKLLGENIPRRTAVVEIDADELHAIYRLAYRLDPKATSPRNTPDTAYAFAAIRQLADVLGGKYDTSYEPASLLRINAYFNYEWDELPVDANPPQ